MAGAEAVQTKGLEVFVVRPDVAFDGVFEIGDGFEDDRATILSEETDPNKLHDLKNGLDGYQVYAPAQVDDLVTLYLGGADRDKLDPILDACVAVYNEQLDEDWPAPIG